MSEADPPLLEERVALLEQQLRTANRRRRRDWDAYAAAIASLVGLLALLVGGYTAYLQRQQVRAQVWPRLGIGSTNLDRKLIAANHGVGPARVQAVKVQVGGKVMKKWAEVVEAIGHKKVGFMSGFLNGRVLPPGAEVVIFEAYPDKPDSAKMFDDFLENKAKFSILICYCSVLDDCWITARGYFPAAEMNFEDPIDHCPIAREDEFKN